MVLNSSWWFYNSLVWHPTLVKICILCTNCISSDNLVNISLHRQAQALQITKKTKVNIDNTLLGDSFHLNPFLFFKAPFLAIHMATTDIWPCARKIKGRYKKFFWSFFPLHLQGTLEEADEMNKTHRSTTRLPFLSHYYHQALTAVSPKKPWLTHTSTFGISTGITHFFLFNWGYTLPHAFSS